jgi:hypothetical protein
MAKAYSVTHVQADVLAFKGGTVIIFVVGTVPTSGWTGIGLSPWVYISPPADGIQDFDLEGTPPADISLNVITPVATAAAIPNPPSWLKGVRIHASSNNREALLGESLKIEFPEKDTFWDGDLPWPDVLSTFVGNG